MAIGALGQALVVFAVAGLPIVEVRLSVVWGYSFGMDAWLVCLLTFLGNLAVIAPVWFMLPHLERGARRSERVARFLDRLYAKTRKHTAKWERVEEGALFTIVALVAVPIPLPGSGLYTALVAQHVFGIPMRKAFVWLAAGLAVACVGATLFVYLGGEAIRRWFLI